ncbi:MAG TPA: hypothetical protein VMB49_14705 [Acidobacteriaceae bacterium]|nr:hypothetical protein [Acidobacteriaceae bacterium]
MKPPNFVSVDHGSCWPTQPFPALARIRQAGSRSFAQDLSFELGEDGQKPGHCSTGRCGQIPSGDTQNRPSVDT